jgi:hypothetical protein
MADWIEGYIHPTVTVVDTPTPGSTMTSWLDEDTLHVCMSYLPVTPLYRIELTLNEDEEGEDD